MPIPNVREITVGGVSKADLLEQLKNSSILINPYAEILFASPEFTTSSHSCNLKISEVSLQEISLKEGATSTQIFSRAKDFGLELCPLELAPHFRLQYLNQLQGPYLTIASKKTRNDESYPNGFYLRKLKNRLWLRGYRASSDFVWSPQSRFVFLVN